MPTVPAPETRKKFAAGKATLSQDAVKAAVERKKTRAAFAKEVLQRSVASHRALAAREKQAATKRHVARAAGNYYVEAEPKVAFVIRIRGICDMPPKERKILRLLRLRQIFNGVFVRLTKAMLVMLRRVNPYIAWGYPTAATIRKLILKRGHAKVKDQRLKITSNDLVQANLRKHGLLCVEDLVYQIATAGPQFNEAAGFLWPFKLSAPRGGFRAKRKHFVEGGDYGNREEYVNKLVLRML